MEVRAPSKKGMIPYSLMRDATAIRTNTVACPPAELRDLTNRRKRTGAIQAATGTIHLPFEKAKSVIPAINSRDEDFGL
jgi:hypothetical protein